jgi:hypothetical protein
MQEVEEEAARVDEYLPLPQLVQSESFIFLVAVE